MGDARLPYRDIMYSFFDLTLKGEKTPVMDTMPGVRYYVMGLNQWKTADTWPPAGAAPLTFYLSSGGKGNTLNGKGTLTTKAPAADSPDLFTYDPMKPVPTLGGYRVGGGSGGLGGAFDPRKGGGRGDVLGYTTQTF